MVPFQDEQRCDGRDEQRHPGCEEACERVQGLEKSPHHVLSPWFRIVLITLLRMTWWLSFTGRWRSRGLNETMNEWGPAGLRVNRRPCFRVLTGCSRAERRLRLCECGYPHDSSRNLKTVKCWGLSDMNPCLFFLERIE